MGGVWWWSGRSVDVVVVVVAVWTLVLVLATWRCRRSLVVRFARSIEGINCRVVVARALWRGATLGGGRGCVVEAAASSSSLSVVWCRGESPSRACSASMGRFSLRRRVKLTRGSCRTVAHRICMSQRDTHAVSCTSTCRAHRPRRPGLIQRRSRRPNRVRRRYRTRGFARRPVLIGVAPSRWRGQARGRVVVVVVVIATRDVHSTANNSLARVGVRVLGGGSAQGH